MKAEFSEQNTREENTFPERELQRSVEGHFEYLQSSQCICGMKLSKSGERIMQSIEGKRVQHS